jgi:LPS O-antigen subunit length determinant protein (WzzB/FepE family)
MDWRQKLSWDLRTSFLAFKQFYENKDNLYSFLIDYLQGDMRYPKSLNPEDEDATTLMQQEIFYQVVDEFINAISESLKESIELREFKDKLPQNLPEGIGAFLRGDVNRILDHLYNNMLQNFIEKT